MVIHCCRQRETSMQSKGVTWKMRAIFVTYAQGRKFIWKDSFSIAWPANMMFVLHAWYPSLEKTASKSSSLLPLLSSAMLAFLSLNTGRILFVLVSIRWQSSLEKSTSKERNTIAWIVDAENRISNHRNSFGTACFVNTTYAMSALSRLRGDL